MQGIPKSNKGKYLKQNLSFAKKDLLLKSWIIRSKSFDTDIYRRKTKTDKQRKIGQEEDKEIATSNKIEKHLQFCSGCGMKSPLD